MYFVYSHTNVANGKRYIGFTGKTVESRFANHCAYAKAGSMTIFHRAIRKYGEKSWVSEVLATAETENEAKALEVKFIALYKTDKRDLGYNMTPGGDGNSNTGRKLSPEHAAKLTAVLARIREETTPEQYKTRGEKRRGELRSEDARKTISEGIRVAKANGLTEAQMNQIKTMHKKNRGNKRSDETRQKITNALAGKPRKRKLLEEQVKEIMESKLTRIELAKKFGVDFGTITRAKKNFLNKQTEGK